LSGNSARLRTVRPFTSQVMNLSLADMHYMYCLLLMFSLPR